MAKEAADEPVFLLETRRTIEIRSELWLVLIA